MVREDWRKRLDMLGYLARRAAAGEGTPSVREVGTAVGLKSSQAAHKHLRKLEDAGYIERESGKARSTRLTEKGWEAVGHAPLLGRVAAGRGLEAIAIGDEAYSLIADLLMPRRSGKVRYLLRVIGQSMEGAWIGDGSIVLVEEDEDPAEGEVVVALLRNGEEVTVKRLYREGETVRLRPESAEHEDIVVSAEEVTVQGRVVSVIQPPRRT